MPFEIAPNLTPQEYDGIKEKLPPGMMVRPVYVRIYPNGKVAGQIVGYTGKTGRNPDGIVDNHETIWPQTEGREGSNRRSTKCYREKRRIQTDLRQGRPENIGETRYPTGARIQRSDHA